MKFVQGEAELANDPVFSPDALFREKRRQYPGANRGKGRKGGPPSADSFVTETTQASRCPFCAKGHSLEKCPEFKKKTPDERGEFVISKGLCFGCLASGHLSMNCRSRLNCKECGRSHPTVLHGSGPKRNPKRTPKDVKKSDNNGAATAASSGAQSKSEPRKEESTNANTSLSDHATDHGVGATTCMVVPVVLSHKDNPSAEINTYALLDDGSDSTFIKSSTLKKLDLDGPEITLKLNTMYGQTEIAVKKIEGLVVQRIDKTEPPIALPKAYSRDSIPSRRDQIPTPEIASRWPQLAEIKDDLLPLQKDMEVGILIGCNCPKALKPRDVILGEEDEPYAIKTSLGWGTIGPSNPSTLQESDAFTTCHRLVTCEIGGTRLDSRFAINTLTKEMIKPSDVGRMFEIDFSEKDQGDIALSRDDRKFLEIVKSGVRHRPDGHYEMPLPIKEPNLVLPNNRALAYSRLKPLKKRGRTSDETYRKHYVEFMNSVIQNNYAELVPQNKTQIERKAVWYIPHHGVYHPKKPHKIRVVFDCSAQFEGESLNKHLLQSPDLTNNLTGVLCRFRRELVAVMCDIEAMFYQVKVPEDCRDLLRFLWWEDGDTSREPKEYRMTVHLFGAASSPGCSNFALKTTASDNEDKLGSAAAEFLRRDFYVDDGLKSVPSIEDAVELVRSVKEMCKRGGFNLHKFTSNNKEVIQHIPEADRAEDIKNLDFVREVLPVERALGVQCCIESDVFKFTIALRDRPCTRRGILSTVSSIFDPLGFVAPVLLEGKSILQELCRQNVGWDDPVPEEIQARWQKWKAELQELQNFSIPRCYKPADFGPVAKADLHHFSDASLKGYSQCSYLRMVDTAGKIHCSFVIGKARVTPLKKITVPRLELTAAVVSVRVSEQLKKELDVDITKEVFWTDSKVVLGYIANEVRRFHVFVKYKKSRLQIIG